MAKASSDKKGSNAALDALLDPKSDFFGGPLEERIRDLCAKVVAAPDRELEPIILELQAALREHALRLRRMAAENLAGRIQVKRLHQKGIAHQDLKDTSTTG